MRKLFFLGVLSLALVAGSQPGFAIRIGDILRTGKDVVDVVKVFTIGDKEEVGIGGQIHQQLVWQYGGEYHNGALKGYLNRIGQSLAKKSGRTNIPYRFTVLNTNIVNAFATMGGYVYVTRGILKMVRDEAELASVVGHEIGHIVGKHALNRIKQVMVVNKVGKYTGHLGEGVVGQLTNIFANIAITGHGRKNELSADKLGLHMANSAGYDPNGAVRLFQHFLQLEGGGSKHPIDQFFSSHPPTQKRLGLAKKEINQLPKKGTRVNKAAYLSMRNRVQ